MKIFVSDIISRVQLVIFHPKEFWKAQKEEEIGVTGLFFGFLFPLILAASILVFLGEFFRSAHFYIGFAVLKALREFVFFTLQFFVSVFFTNELMKTFGGEKNIGLARKLVAYSMTPFVIISMLTGLIQYFYLLDILGLYSFYIFWIGGKELLDLPEQKRDSYLIITILVNFFIFSFLSILLTKLLTAYF